MNDVVFFIVLSIIFATMSFVIFIEENEKHGEQRKLTCEMKKELKPCPFCGGDGELCILPRGAYCHCIKCGCELVVSVYKKDAIEAWNRRIESGK